MRFFDKFSIIQSMQTSWYRLLVIVTLCLTSTGQAMAYLSSPSLGGVANNLTNLTASLSNLLVAGSFIIGFGFAVGSIIKYKDHRDNPQQVTMSTVVTMVVVALAFLCLGAILYVTGQGIFGPGAETGAGMGVDTIQ